MTRLDIRRRATDIHECGLQRLARGLGYDRHKQLALTLRDGNLAGYRDFGGDFERVLGCVGERGESVKGFRCGGDVYAV